MLYVVYVLYLGMVYVIDDYGMLIDYEMQVVVAMYCVVSHLDKCTSYIAETLYNIKCVVTPVIRLCKVTHVDI